ncbi:MAG: ABC transporter permease [Clostridia bacterium]|nr:ABC transporter permease [Clostridia bacterium]
MLKLIKLEIRKYKIKGYIRGALIANLVIIGFLFLMNYTGKAEGDIIRSYDEAFAIIDTFVKGTFMIFSSVLIANIIIDEYRSKTINVMFMYPINRKKLFAAKLVIVLVFSFTSIILSDIIVSFSYYFLNSIFSFVTEELTSTVIVNSSIKFFMNALAFSGAGLIPLFFGMRKKSFPATIVSSILITSILSSSSNDFSLGSIIAIPMTLAAVGILVAYLTIRNIEHADVEN